MKFPCDLSQEMLPMKRTLSKMTSQPLPVPAKLMLEVSGLDAGKFRIVQFPSILICEGGTGLTKPSITPPKLATQPPTDCARAGTALSNNRPKANSRILIQLPRGLALFVSLEVIYALVPLTKRFHRDRGSPRCGLDSGGPAVVGPLPVRPVTLRSHLSNGFAFVKIASNLTDQIRCFSKPPGVRAIPLRPPTSRRRQEVDRVHDRHGRHTIFRAEIDRPDAANHLCGEIRGTHVSRLQHAHRHAAVRLDRQTQNHLAFQGWVIAQLPVVQPVERRLVAIEHDLYFLVGAGRTWSAACLRSVGTSDRSDRADCAAYPHTTNPASSATASAAAAHTAAPIAPSASSATASYTAAQGGDVDATARSRRIARQQRACRGPAHLIGGNVTRIGSERHHDGVLCQVRELVLECEDADVSHLRLCLHRKAHLRTWWQFRFAS